MINIKNYRECLAWTLNRFNNDCDVDITTKEFERIFNWFIINYESIKKIIKSNG